MKTEKARRVFAALCVLLFLFSLAPLLAACAYTHPYYDDFGFSAPVRQAWVNTGSLREVWRAALENCRVIRNGWQGTYTGTFLTNLQPGLFSERLYGLGCLFLILTFEGGFALLFSELGLWAGLDRVSRVVLVSLVLFVLTQCMPDAAEGFYWFNGGIGNTFIYACLAAAAALSLKYLRTEKTGMRVLYAVLLVLLMAVLGGGSYGGGLLALCLFVLLTARLLLKKRREGWLFLLLTLLLGACFAYSVSAFGNRVRAVQVMGWFGSPAAAVVRALYYGVAQIGSSVRLPVIGVTVILLPALYRGAKASRCRFAHPWITGALAVCLYCTQLTPPLYGGVFIGGGRIVNTYWFSFVVLWLCLVWYFCGVLARKREALPEKPDLRPLLAAAGACLLLTGCMGFRTDDAALPGIQNLRGAQAALSLVNGEMQAYHRDMFQREELLNGPDREVTLPEISAVPAVFMPDELGGGAVYDVRPALCLYYGKDAVHTANETVSEE